MAQKSLQGLDYITADGRKAFDELIEMVLKLSNDNRVWVSCLQKVLKEAKQYIKGDYKVWRRAILQLDNPCTNFQ